MKREELRKEKALHICILCGKENEEEKMYYSKTKNRGTVWFCEECYKNECRGIKEKETTETNPKKGD
nr:MAG TPA: ATP-dependent Clp protease ATP-binding subunit [Caudoviricetes sp.]